EHHGKLSAFSVRSHWRLGRGRRRGAEGLDGVEQAPTVPDQDNAKVFQVLGGQVSPRCCRSRSLETRARIGQALGRVAMPQCPTLAPPMRAIAADIYLSANRRARIQAQFVTARAPRRTQTLAKPRARSSTSARGSRAPKISPVANVGFVWI